MLRAIWLGCALGLLALAGSARAQDGVYSDIEGRWNTNVGVVTISRTDTGRFAVDFDDHEGTAEGTLEANRFRGEWVDVTVDETCPTETGGSSHWGTFEVTFHGPPIAEKPVFQGYWMFCGDETQGTNFTGERAD